MQFHHNEAIATLFVIGDVCVNNAILEPRFEKIPNHPGYEGRLVLQIVPNVLSEEGLETEVLYAEELENIGQYNGVTILVNNEVFVEIDELECIY